MHTAFHSILGSPLQLQGILASQPHHPASPSPISPVTSPCATTAAPCPTLLVPSPLVSSLGGPLSTLPHDLPSFPCQTVAHISCQKFPAPVSHLYFHTRFLTVVPKYLLYPKSSSSIFLSRLLQSTCLYHLHK